jgi:hypothetical protein
MSIIHTLQNVSPLPRIVGLASVIAILALATVSAATAQQKFQTPEAAADALAAAARQTDRKAVLAILGPGADDVVSSGDPVADEETRKLFVAAYDLKHQVVTASGKPATLVIGESDYPFPIPIVQKDGSWMFDTAAGREEILARRIGRNELAAIQVCLAFYDAQNEYADITPKADGMSVYAQRLVSNAGKKDGLYWPAAQGEQQSPIGPAVALASVRGYKVGSGEPFHGYRYKILLRQGPSAPGGALEYVIGGKMIGGFALVAWPAEYGNSGIVTFMINHNGDVYEKDLGNSTSRIASRMTSYNPDHTWRKIVQTEQQR